MASHSLLVGGLILFTCHLATSYASVNAKKGERIYACKKRWTNEHRRKKTGVFSKETLREKCRRKKTEVCSKGTLNEEYRRKKTGVWSKGTLKERCRRKKTGVCSKGTRREKYVNLLNRYNNLKLVKVNEYKSEKGY